METCCSLLFFLGFRLNVCCYDACRAAPSYSAATDDDVVELKDLSNFHGGKSSKITFIFYRPFHSDKSNMISVSGCFKMYGGGREEERGRLDG